MIYCKLHPDEKAAVVDSKVTENRNEYEQYE